MLPFTLLNCAIRNPILIELKNGETYNGQMEKCDNHMNFYLKDVICTSKDGDKFWRISECFVKGSQIKYIRLPDEVINLVKDDPRSSKHESGNHQKRGSKNQRGAKRPRHQ